MSIMGKVGEWYWGAKCPTCGQMAAHAHDPMRGKGDTRIESEQPDKARTTMTCPNGHALDVPAKDLVRFEWGAQ